MKLDEVRDLVQTGDIFLFRGRKWYSWLIRLRTLSVYSHVGVAYRLRVNGHHRLCIFEAVNGQGVRLHPLDVYLEECMRAGCQVDWYAVTDNGIDRERVAEFCLRNWAKRYASVWQFAWSWGLLARWLRKLLRRPAEMDRERFFCSKLVDAAYRYAGYKPDEAETPDETDPGAIARYTCLRRMGRVGP